MKKLTKIEFTGDYDKSFENAIPNGVLSYTHYTLKNGGVILSSNKNFPDLKKAKVFIPYHKIDFIH